MSSSPLPESVRNLQARLREMGEQARAQQQRVAEVKAALQAGRITPEEAQAAIAEANRLVLESLKQLEDLQGRLRSGG